MRYALSFTHSLFLALSLLVVASTVQAEWTPAADDAMELSVAQAILEAKAKDPGLAHWFDSAAGFAVLPKVGKAGLGIGGARGKGLLISGDSVLGEVTLTQLTVGFQAGGQMYMEFVFFKDQANLTTFKEGNFEMGAQISAVAVTAGASADANYSKGVAVFTIAQGGLMYEAAVSGQKFNFKAR